MLRRKTIDALIDRAHNQLTMAKRNHISVEIDATFGSDFQEEVALHLLDKHIAGWREFFLEKHCKNAIEYRIINAELSCPRPRRLRRPVL
jgi:hypothetical protein